MIFCGDVLFGFVCLLRCFMFLSLLRGWVEQTTGWDFNRPLSLGSAAATAAATSDGSGGEIITADRH